MTPFVQRMLDAVSTLVQTQTENRTSLDHQGLSLGDLPFGRHLLKIVAANPEDARNTRLLAHLVGIRYAPQIRRYFREYIGLVEAARRMAFSEMTTKDRTRICGTVVFERISIAGHEGLRVHGQNQEVFHEFRWVWSRIRPRFLKPNVMTLFASHRAYLRAIFTSGRNGSTQYEVIETDADLQPFI